MVLTAYSALSPATNSSCHRHRRIWLIKARSGRLHLRQLDTSNGCQDHTALPSAAIVVRLLAVDRSRVFRQPALRSHRAPNAAASTASHPNVRDDRDTPLSVGQDVRISASDLPDDTSARACDKATRRAIFAWRLCANCPSCKISNTSTPHPNRDPPTPAHGPTVFPRPAHSRRSRHR